MIDVKAAGPFWVALNDERLFGSIWFREVDPPYRVGKGFQVWRLCFGICFKTDAENELDVLDGRETDYTIDEIAEWDAPEPEYEEWTPFGADR